VIHFINQYSQSPPIDWFPMALIQQNLGGNVLGSPTERIGPGFDDLGESEISEFQVAVRSDQQILGFQITVDYVQVVHVLEHGGHGGREETRNGIFKVSLENIWDIGKKGI
jgi:hypothetical protein